MDQNKPIPKEEIIVNGYAYPSISPEVLYGWMRDLTFITAFSYGFTQKGELIQLDDSEIIRVARENGVEPLMALTPFDKEGAFSSKLVNQLLENPDMQKKLIDNLLINLKSKNLFGVDFDFVYIDPEYKERYTNFITEATIRLNDEGFLAMVAITPNQSSEVSAANFVLLATFEWWHGCGPPMAVSPINEIRKVLDSAALIISPDKILLGIPNYGYDWTLPHTPGMRAQKVFNVEAMEIAKRTRAKIFFDEVAQAPYFYYTGENGAEHVVWFEDARSIRAKLALISEYGLAGASYWNVMELFPIGSEVLHSMFTVKKIT